MTLAICVAEAGADGGAEDDDIVALGIGLGHCELNECSGEWCRHPEQGTIAAGFGRSAAISNATK